MSNNIKTVTVGVAESVDSNAVATNAYIGNTVATFDARRETSEPNQEVDEDSRRMARKAKQHKKWNRRLKVFFCCLGYKKNKDSIADIASIFAEFYADLDVPSSDVAAGFVLCSKYQSAQRQWIVDNHQLNVDQYLSSIPITNETNFLDISTAEDSHLINDLIYYMNYSLAIFGWPMQVVDDPCMLCCIFPYLRFCRCCSSNNLTKRSAKVGISENNLQEPPKQEKKRKKKSKKSLSSNNDKNATNINDQGKEFKQEVNKNIDIDNNNNNINIVRRPSLESKPGILSDDCNGPIILEDNCCGCNVASVERRLSAHNYEIIYVTYRVDVNIVPFLVAADHSKQSVVVAMRGSMSLSDMVTDMNGQADKIPIDDCPDDWLSHRGITRASNYVKSKLLDEHILDRAFNCRPDLGSKDYNLILCGHSLGAGVAAILGILMRKQYPSLKAYLYSPPGGILSLPAVEYTKQFATGIILGNDCVPRLGIAQLERLRYHVLLSLKSSEKSTYKILTKAIFPTFCFGGNKVEYDPNKSLNLLYGTEGRSFDYNGNRIPFQVQPHVLYVPGRLIHIVKNYSFKTSRRFFNEPIYQAIWNDNTTYDRLFITKGMLFDHLPNHLMHAMKMLFSKTLPGRKDSKISSVYNDTYIQSKQHGSEISNNNNNQYIEPTVYNNKNNEDDNGGINSNIVKKSKECEIVIENNDNNNNKKVLDQDENNNINDGKDLQTIKSINAPNEQLNQLVKNNLEKNKNSFKLELQKNKHDEQITSDNNGNDDSFLNKNKI